MEGTAVTKVLFACVHNAGRSQMARAWFEELADPALAKAISAGTEPAEQVHPEVKAVMAELGMDLSQVTPQYLTDELAAGCELLITMGCGEVCPVVPGLRREDWPLVDPKGQSLADVRVICEAIRQRVAGLLEREGWAWSAKESPRPLR